MTACCINCGVDLNLWVCGRRGHLTYAPTEDDLRARLRTETALGAAWRCLRCGTFVLGEPKLTGPAADAPLVPRGRALRDAIILRLLAFERFTKGLLVLLAGYGVIQFRGSRDAVERAFHEDVPLLKPFADKIGWDLEDETHAAALGRQGRHFTHAIHMAVDQVPTELVAELERHFEIEARPFLPVAKVGLVEGLAGGLDGEPVGPLSITVRQHPEQAIEAPIATDFMSCLVRMTKRRSPACPPGLTAVIWPMSVTMPVNIPATYVPRRQVSSASPPTTRLATRENRGAKSSFCSPRDPTAGRPSAPSTRPPR